MQRKRILILLAVLLITSLACGFSRASTDTPQEGIIAEVPATEESAQEIIPDLGKKEVNSIPVSLNKGLSTLDYYKMTIEIETIGPSQRDVTREKITMEYAEPQEASYISIDNYSVSAEDPDVNSGISYIWRIANDRCTGSDDPDDDFEFESSEPDAREMADLMLDLFDMNFMVENPQFIAEESMNGIQTNHFTFQLSGLGVKSGATVLANQGEYWLAVDGDYIVRYSLLVQTSSSPEKINHLRVYANLAEINTPRTINMPRDCYNAQ